MSSGDRASVNHAGAAERQPGWRPHEAPQPQGAALILELRRIQALRQAPHKAQTQPAAPEAEPARAPIRTVAKAEIVPEPPREPQVTQPLARQPMALEVRGKARPRTKALPKEATAAPPPPPPMELPQLDIRDAADAPAPGSASRRRRAPSLKRIMASSLESVRSRLGALVVPGDAALGGLDDQLLVPRVRRAYERELKRGLQVLVIGGGVVGLWAAVVPLSGAVVVAGNLVVESNVKKVQHPTGGVVARIAADDGMRVKEGDLLARLDETQARTNLQVVSKQLDELRVRIARLTAERDDSDGPSLPRELASRPPDKDLEQLFHSELLLFKARATARQSQKELLHSHVSQLGQQIDGLGAQVKSNSSQLNLISTELQAVQSLYDKHLVPLTRVTALQREAARLEGERGQLMSSIAEARSKISEAELQIVRIDQDFRTEVMKDLRESQDKEAELAERSVAAQDQLNRIDIRAPTSGVVHQLAVHTIGGVVTAGEVIMEIVPDSDELQVEARLQPNDIDQVRLGQRALIRFSAFNQRTTPQLTGVVSYISADLTRDRQTNAPYYTVRTTLPAEERRRLGDLQLVSGMPAEMFLQTGSRTMASYLLKPITDQLKRAFNER